MQDAPKAVWSIPHVSVAFLENMEDSYTAITPRFTLIQSDSTCLDPIYVTNLFENYSYYNRNNWYHIINANK